MRKRILALIMAVCVSIVSLPQDASVYAAGAEVTDQMTADNGMNETEEKDITPEEGGMEALLGSYDETSPGEGSGNSSDTEDAGTEESETEDTEENNLNPVFNYIMVESDYIQTPGTQNVVASIGTEEMELSDLALIYRNETTGEAFTAQASAKAGDMVRFSMDFTDDSAAGAYRITGITCTYQGLREEIDLEALGMEVTFGVNVKVETNPDDVLVDEEAMAEIEANVVQMDENGNVISENTIADVAENGISELDLGSGLKRGGNLVVVLDPGHDDTHSGASYYGAREEELVLKIAAYCRDELKTYSGVTVHMVRETGACPYSGYGWISSGTCNEKRVEFAKSVGANIYVSFHLNASGSTSVNGVGIFYPNTNYRPDLSDTGKQLAQKILEKLTALGLGQWSTGIMTQNSSDYTYDDGSTADYLGVIRNCKKAGIPAVLIEHAFLSGTNDYYNYLNSDEKLKALGVADATAIAEKYGLVKGSGRPTISYAVSQSGEKLKLGWSAATNAVSYEIWRSTDAASYYKQIATVENALTYTDDKITAGETYYYRVRAVFANGAKSEFSDPGSGIALEPPALLSVASKSSKKLEVVWQTVSGASGYKIYRKNNSTGKYEQVAKVSGGDTTSYVDSVASNNTFYYYKVQAYQTVSGREGVGSYSAAMKAKAVGVPSNLTAASADDSTLKISWKKVSGADEYELYRSTSKDGTYKKIAILSSDETSYEDTSVKTGRIYYYKIQATNLFKGRIGYSGLSSAVSGQTAARTQIQSVKSVNATTLEIKWEKIDGASGYIVKRSTKENGTYKTIKTINAKDTISYKDTKRVSGKMYYYKVEVMNKVGDTVGYSGDSDAVGGKTAEVTDILYVASTDQEALEIAWTQINDAWGYTVKRSTSKNGTYKSIATLKGKKKTMYTDTSVTAGKKYYYKVEVINKVNGVKGYSGDSAAVSGKTLASTSFTTIKAVDSNAISLKWKKSEGAGGYLIYRSTSKKGNYETVATVKGGSVVTYTDKNLAAGKTYYYKIQAFKKNKDKRGLSPLSSAKKAWTLDQAVITKVTGTSGGKVTLEWNTVANASGYSIYRSLSASGGFKKIGTTDSADNVTYTDKNIETGQVYYYRVAANNIITGKTVGRGKYSAVIKVPVLSKAGMSGGTLQENNVLSLAWKTTANASGYELACSLQEDGNFVTLTKTAATSYLHQNLQPGVTYYYKIRAYSDLGGGMMVYGPWSSVFAQTAGYAIMGSSSVSVDQMVSYYNARYTYPADIYGSRGAQTAADFFTIVKQEAEAEGVKTEILFAQVILETGGLSFNGDVSAYQCNFGGLGAVGNGAQGETFPDVRTGLRAQVQHLKAYASTAALVNPCVDTRFQYVKRGSAPYVEWLAIPKNPNGGGWAADPDYGTKLLNIIHSL